MPTQYEEGFADAKEGIAPRKPGREYFRGYYDGRKEWSEEEDVD